MNTPSAKVQYPENSFEELAICIETQALCFQL